MFIKVTRCCFESEEEDGLAAGGGEPAQSDGRHLPCFSGTLPPVLFHSLRKINESKITELRTVVD